MLFRQLDRFFVARYLPWTLCLLLFLINLWAVWSCDGLCRNGYGKGMNLLVDYVITWGGTFLFGGLTALGVYDMQQQQHAITRNYPVVGHLRFLFEEIRPEIRQYFLEADTDELPFSRAQRSLVYQRAKDVLDARPFGTQLNTYGNGYEWLNHSVAPSQLESHDFRVVVGEGRKQPYSMSIFNISGMSFGSLSSHAILALNKGAKLGGFAHNSGEGSVSKYHSQHGGDLIMQVASGYFGCRNDDGTFSPDKFRERCADSKIKMIEVKLSQGAKPGHGGMLPGRKVTPEIAEARGIPEGVDCISPASHGMFSTPIEMMYFIEQLRELSGGKPVGIKLCIGQAWEWFAIVKAMLKTDIVPDFITIDGAEGGTGAAPLEFSNNIGTPVQEGLILVHNTLVGTNLRHRIRIAAAGKIVSAFDILHMMALGADYCNAARGFMFAIGCIQAQSCHTGACPTGVATQDKKRQLALNVKDKSERVYDYHRNTMEAVKEMVEAAGLEHPGDVSKRHIMRRIGPNKVRSLDTLIKSVPYGELLDGRVHGKDLPTAFLNYWEAASADSFSINYCPVNLVS